MKLLQEETKKKENIHNYLLASESNFVTVEQSYQVIIQCINIYYRFINNRWQRSITIFKTLLLSFHYMTVSLTVLFPAPYFQILCFFLFPEVLEAKLQFSNLQGKRLTFSWIIRWYSIWISQFFPHCPTFCAQIVHVHRSFIYFIKTYLKFYYLSIIFLM